MKNFQIQIENKIVDRIIKKVSSFDWSKIPDIKNWSLGVNKQELKSICDYWITSYNWEIEEKNKPI